MTSLFFYGTLMHDAILSRVLGRKVDNRTEEAVLLENARHRVVGVDYPAVVPESGHQVMGTLCSGLSQKDLQRLDMFEGDEYERRFVKVKTTHGISEAQTYIYIADASKLDRREWSFAEFTKEKLTRWTGEHSTEYDDVDTTGGRNLGTFWERNTITENNE